MADLVGGCLGSILTQIQYNICNARQYGADATCCDSCCRFNCCWKNGALPVEDYPIANSGPADRTQSVDGAANTAKTQEADGDASLPTYSATPQMSVMPATETAAASAPVGGSTTATTTVDGKSAIQ